MSIVSGTVGAVMGSSATEAAAEKGAAAQDRATEAQERIYALMREDFEPYRQLGLNAIPYLQSAIYGSPVSVTDQRYTRIDDNELAALNRQAQPGQLSLAAPTQQAPNSSFSPLGTLGTVVLRNSGQSANVPTTVPTGQAGSLRYDPSKTWYRGPNGEITSTPPSKQVAWTPGESPAAKYQLEKGNVSLMRGLGARGLAGSGYAPVKQGDLAKSVAAADWNDQYSRLLDMIKVGTGASSATGGQASSLSSAYGQGATNLANLYNQAGQAKASLYGGMGEASANSAAAGLRLYDYGKTAKWWGAGAGVGSTAAASAPTYAEGANGMYYAIM